MAGDLDARFEFAIELLVRGLEAMGRQLSLAVRTGSEVGVVEPPTGSVLTSTVSTPFEVAGHRWPWPSRRGAA